MKVDDYNLSKLSNEAENFKEDVQNILNYGKYSAQVVNNTPPAWTARNGEFVFFASGAVKRVYFYNINAWDYLEYNGGGTTGSLKSVQTFTANGTWTRPSGIAGVVVEVVGGGGGGGGTNAAGGAGGGGGGYAKLLTGSPGTAQTVTIGAGGAGGVSGGGAGSAGGTTSFGSLVSASGGSGGDAGTASNPGAAGGAGGVGSSGTINLAGESGHRGTTGVGNANSFETGGGGNSGNGMGPGAAAWLAVAQNQAGNSGTLYGGGGGGGVRNNVDQVGGAGAAGICIVWEYS